MVTKAINKFYEQKKLRNWEIGYWAFDIHGTILKPNYKLGNIPSQFYPMAKETLQLISKFKDITMLLYTCSHPHEIEEYLKLFKENDINFTWVNENKDVTTNIYGYGNYDKKPYMNVLFEDKAGFDADNDWQEIYSLMLLKC
jgi:hydroxymethylpyrimidine pyrophosphatase-like HAD family hydrolase